MAKTVGFGSVLSYTSTTGEINIAQIQNIDGPDGSPTDVDTTTLDSSTNFRTFARGPVDPGNVSMTLVYDPAADSHKRLGTLYSSGTAKTFTIYHGSSTGDSDAITAYVASMSRAIPLDDVITCDVTLKVSGDPVYTTT
jgi:hypothetical protein